MAELVRVAAKSDIAAGEAKSFEVGKRTIAVFNVGGSFYAIDEFCTHAGGPLSEGQIDGDKVECPWHCAEFNVKTGEVLSPPAPCGVATYPVHVEGDDLKIEVPD